MAEGADLLPGAIAPRGPGRYGWRTIRVDDLVRAGELRVDDGYRVTNAELGDRNGTPFVRGGDIRHDGSIDTNVQDHVLPEYYSRLGSKLARPGDVAFITKGTVGRVGYLRPGQPECVFSPQVCYWRSLKHTVLQPRFLYYLLSGREFQANLDAVKTHGAMAADYVSISDQRAFRLTLPSAKEQLAIATVLGALDDKLELNRRMNETLEEMARALFKSWFVDFDPVHAKAAGKKPFGMDETTAELFPDRLNTSDAGHIPHGWELVSLGDALQLKRGYDLPKDKRRPGPVPICSSSGMSGFHDEAKAPGPGVVTGRYGTIGEVFFIDEDYWPLNTALYVRSFGRLLPRIAYYALKSIDFGKYADKAAVPGINRNDVHRAPVVLAPGPVQEAFQLLVEPLMTRVRCNRSQSSALASLRDSLLPKLLSGELRLKDAERVVGEVT